MFKVALFPNIYTTLSGMALSDVYRHENTCNMIDVVHGSCIRILT